MSVAASAIISRVRTQLIDNGASGPVRWTDAELLQWIADAQRTICALIPAAAATVVIVQMVAGTRQNIPANGIIYLKAYRNMGPTGTVGGQGLEQVPRSLMDTQYPTWHAAAPVAAPVAVIFDDTDWGAYYVYPPSDGTGKLELLYALEATDLVATTDLLVVSDIYQTPILDYVMWRCALKDSDYAPGLAAAAVYLSAFSGFLANMEKDTGTLATQGGQT